MFELYSRKLVPYMNLAICLSGGQGEKVDPEKLRLEREMIESQKRKGSLFRLFA